MIDNETYTEILDAGLTLDHYLILCNIKNGVKLHSNKRVQGFVNLLTKKGFIKEDELTEKGLLIVENCSFATVAAPEVAAADEDFGDWVNKLHIKCQEKLFKLTGSRQMRDKIDNKSYSFLPNSRDFGKVLYRAIKLYKLNDREKIEKTILAYMESCAKSKNWFPILQYYIMKNNASQLVTDIESLQSGDGETEYKSTQKFV